MCDPAAVQGVDDRTLWAGAEAVCDALVAHDMDALRALTTGELWLRAAAGNHWSTESVRSAAPLRDQ